MMDVLIVIGIALAGGLGAGVRYLIDTSVPPRIRRRFPWGIMLVNLSGSFALGLLAGVAAGIPTLSLATIGFLGGYTTFSTASFDTVKLLRARRYAAALVNGPGMLIGSVALALAGALITGV